MDEIVTYGKNYKLNLGIRVFVKSAKKFCDKLTIIGTCFSEELIDFLNQEGVNLIDSKDISVRHNIDETLSPYTLKVIYFYLYSKNYSNAENLYLCDFTDIFLQKNIFNLIQSNKPYVTSENHKIKYCDTNKTWINTCYNSDVLNLLQSYDILNGGSILGKRLACTSLLEEMCKDMTHIISRIGNYPNIDQASLNKTVYFNKYEFNILNYFEIFNLAHFGNSSVDYKDCNCITINNHEPYVIHQYDVIKELKKFLYDKYQ